MFRYTVHHEGPDRARETNLPSELVSVRVWDSVMIRVRVRFDIRVRIRAWVRVVETGSGSESWSRKGSGVRVGGD